MATKQTAAVVSKAEFALLVGCGKSSISNWIKAGVLSGDALVGSGRNARISVDVAKAQIATRRDVGQSLANGLRTKVHAAVAGERSDLETPSPAVLAYLRDIPSGVAFDALFNGASPSLAYAVERDMRTSLFGVAKLQYGISIPNKFQPTDWHARLAEFGIDQPVDIERWEAERQRWIAEREAESAGED